MTSERIRPIVIGIFRRDDRILVFESREFDSRGRIYYRPLGGSIEFGEYGHQTLAREMREEIGAEVENVRYLGLSENLFRFPDGERAHEIVLIYEADLTDKALYEKDEMLVVEDTGATFKAFWKPLAFFQRGERNMIGIYPGKRLDNPYSGNVVDICPVGALTLKEFRFRTRVWYLKNTPSICAGCARGCNVDVAVGTSQVRMTQAGQDDDSIKRIVPRVNLEVNGHWMCDEGRLSYQRLEAAPRVETAQAPAGKEAEWADAVGHAAEMLKSAGAGGRLGVVVSPRLTCESMFAWKELLDSLGEVKYGVRRLERGEDDDLLIRADKGANSSGAAWIFGTQAAEESVLEAASAGQIDTLLVLGDPLDPEDTSKVGESVRAKLTDLIHVGPFLDGAAQAATVLLPVAAWAEEDGSYVNFEGRIQLVKRCHMPRGEGRPGWRVAADLGAALGLEPPAWSAAGDVLASLAGSVGAFEGLTEEKIGPLGVRSAAAPAGA